MTFRSARLALAVAILFGTQALAAQVAGLAPGKPALAPGKPAGVRAAQASPRPWLLLGAGTVLVGAIAVAMIADDYQPCGSACDVSDVTSAATTN